MKRIILFIAIIVLFTGCSNIEYFDDFDDNVSQPMTFQVREVGLDDIVSQSTEMQLRRDLVAEEPEAEEEEVTGEEVEYSVSTDVLNVRAETSAESEKVGELYYGDEVEMIEEVTDEAGESWSKVTSGDIEGYVLSNYLTTSEVRDPIGTYSVVIYEVNLRSTPSAEGEIVGALGYMEQFLVYDKVEDENGDEWLQTYSDEGIEAYVLSDYCIEIE